MTAINITIVLMRVRLLRRTETNRLKNRWTS
ncbi:uncharacterized protein METZ01_LOCUS436785 [marine metagenome]|uniref:Uncharacterized protein n=1 Tax=marine metagenome TaxID=408172 RepID=A0A382YLM9_9ZZZZ